MLAKGRKSSAEIGSSAFFIFEITARAISPSYQLLPVKTL
jgi:hypothetical protein